MRRHKRKLIFAAILVCAVIGAGFVRNHLRDTAGAGHWSINDPEMGHVRLQYPLVFPAETIVLGHATYGAPIFIVPLGNADTTNLLKVTFPRRLLDEFMADNVPSKERVSRVERYAQNHCLGDSRSAPSWWTPDAVSQYMSAQWEPRQSGNSASLLVDISDSESVVAYIKYST